MREVGIGRPVRRVEDARLLTGHGRFVDDIDLPRQAYGIVLRAPHAHARIAGIASARAEPMPGVLAILTPADAERDELGTFPCLLRPKGRDGKPCAAPPRPALARDKVRFVGDPVAFVVGETVEAAQDAAEAVRIDYEPLDSVTDAEAALAPGAPELHDDAPENLCVDWELGDPEKAADAFAAAATVVSLDLRNNRVVGNPLEPRNALGDFDPGTGRYILYTGTQGVHRIRAILANNIFGVPENLVRVITPDVGGGFGVKLWSYPEHALVLWAARRLGRPVRWTATRSEGFLSDHQGRDLTSHAEMALDAGGEILALRIDSVASVGAYLSNFGPFIPTGGGTRALVGPYRTPIIYARVRAAFTNTAPTDAYRGAGRPENVYLVERLLDAAAAKLGLGPEEIRRRNLIPREAMPYKTPLGQTYDSGDFPAILDAALEASDWANFPKRRSEAKHSGRLKGIGFAFYVDPCGGNRDQRAELRFTARAAMQVAVGTQATGQGHETVFAQIVADRLGLPLDTIQIVQGDSDSVHFGQGSSGSRSLPIGGTAVNLAAERAVERGRRVAAHLLEAAEPDVAFADGIYRVVGTDRSLRFADVLRASYDPASVPAGEDLGLDAQAHHMARDVTFSNGCHVCEVEIEPETGVVRIITYTGVDDFGRVINPLLVDGQVHGGVAQGIGQALLEGCIYDDESGQLLTGSFMDYALPRADDLPAFHTRREEVPCTTNPLGVKGCGESGSIVAPAAVVNAVVDALREHGVRHIDMPITPQKIWKLLHG